LVCHGRTEIAGTVKRFARSFAHAFDGIVDAARSQPNFDVQLIAVVVAMLLSLALHLHLLAFVTIIALALLVLALELVNTSLEAHVDLASSQFQPLAKRAKDVAAGAVLVAAGGAAIAGVALFVAAAMAGYAVPRRPSLDIQTVGAAAVLWAVFGILAKAWLGSRLKGLAGAALALILGAGAACLCLLAHDPRML
jgi:diacylglycerol kinase